jgi:phosphatidylinositol glycan class N
MTKHKFIQMETCSFLSLSLSRPMGKARVVHLSLALHSAYTLLSLSYESLFLICLTGTLASWLDLERSQAGLDNLDLLALSTDPQPNAFEWGDAICSLIFVVYCVASFFGTGNIASLNSFNTRSIHCLVSGTKNPYIMGSILLSKVLLPFLMVAIFFNMVRLMARMQPRYCKYSTHSKLVPLLTSLQCIFLTLFR